MLRVDSSKPCKIIYAICKHEYLSYLIEPHVVQLNPNGEYSLTHQRLFVNTAEEFTACLDDTDRKLIRILQETEQSHLILKYYKKPIRPLEFFSRIYTEEAFEKLRPKIEKKLAEALTLLPGKELCVMSREGYPAERIVQFATEPATVLFHFRRNENETRYYPTIKYKGQRIEFMFKGAEIICNQPAYLLLEDVLYYFEKGIEGKKLLPFLDKRYISIPKSSEKTYYEKFVAPLIEKYPVYAQGFEIISERYNAGPILKPVYTEGGISQIQLFFRYGEAVFPYGDGRQVSVRIENKDDQYFFYRIKRSMAWEKKKFLELENLGLKTVSNLFQNLEVAQMEEDEDTSLSVFNWLNEHHDELIESGFEIEQPEGEKRFFYASPKINLEIREGNDWFDIYAIVYFGSYAIPFIELKQHILNKRREFVLPSGEIAVIPEKWFSQYSNLLYFSDHSDKLQLKKHHIGLVNELATSDYAEVTMNRKLQQLNNFESLEEIPLPQHFNGELRAYQKAGYDWFHFLKKYHFGGCLADDMGLGKTIQTLALLQKNKEDNAANGKVTSLIIMPTSLIYNWVNEAKRFAPEIQILAHTGSLRSRNAAVFSNYDLIITTYGITRIDINLLKDFFFEYIILDESQNIKNAASKSFQAVTELKSRFKLILSGTPVENSVNDLWTQMSFINPGLLGNQAYFQNNFVIPIEKKKDEDKAHRLQVLIKPFILRRTKEQVATELPSKTEKLFYSEMCDEQADEYEKVKSEYRNALLKSIEEGTFAQAKLHVLQGLIKLRQIANHPRLIDESYEGSSGKFDDVWEMLINALESGHKVLVFSQFVRQLTIFRNQLEDQGISYTYLDGKTKNREEEINKFQNNELLRIFLISIKAGGVGLNLTEADYVFILDPWWNPAVEQQAIDRTHRIGQTKKVIIYKFITKNSIEEKILLLQQQKMHVANTLITTEGNFIKSLTPEDIRDLLM
ncbi:DEAD/DEAH box helicase [Mucilaginibacter arboris]|uniref:ATP-dependent helicase n=1 Tax=Mucilaginibacter arboris TaxID=2682090 RepID=A0A7K1SZN8_9SPHI|nr:DEAD/DEAH box helicase [Mucilaginibacter arboris]MVN22784.1 ATP-dependent helicase [Mucilaginibacter arboris]